MKFSPLIDVLGALLITFYDPFWWHYPWGWHLVMALSSVLEFAGAGLVLAKFTMGQSAA